jgi:hypothetical protein
MDLFQPVTLHAGVNFDPIHYKNLRLAVIAVMTDLMPDQKDKALIRGKDGWLGISEITQIYEDLKPLNMVQNGWRSSIAANSVHAL